MTEDEDYQPKNRERGKPASYGRFWCDVCDYSFISELDKCPVCGMILLLIKEFKND